MAEFPKVKLKTGKPSLNLNIMNAVVHCQAKCRPTQNDMTGFCVDFENMACNQNWYKPNEDKWKQDQKNWNQRKKHAGAGNLRYQFLSWKTSGRWFLSGALISLQHLAQALLNRSIEEVKT